MGKHGVILMFVTLALAEVLQAKEWSWRRSVSEKQRARARTSRTQPIRPPTGNNMATSATQMQYQLLGESFYNPKVIPNDAKVTMGIVYNCGIPDDDDRTLESSAWLVMQWTDDRLVWNPEYAGGVAEFRASSEDIWTPDIKLYNAIKPTVYEEVDAMIASDGRIILVVPVQMFSLCRRKHSSYGDYECTLTFGSWTYSTSLFNLVDTGDAAFRLGDYAEDCPYTAKDPEVAFSEEKFDCCPETYGVLQIKFKLSPQD